MGVLVSSNQQALQLLTAKIEDMETAAPLAITERDNKDKEVISLY